MAFAIVALLLLIDLSGDVFRNGTVVTNDSKVNQNTNQVAVNANAPDDSNITTNTSVSTADEAEWQTFSNEIVGYEFMYPADLQANTCSDEEIALVSLNGVKCDIGGGAVRFQLTRQPSTYNQATNIAQIKVSITNPTTTTLEIDGLTATRISGVTTAGGSVNGGGGKHIDYVFFMKDGRDYTVSADSLSATAFRAEDFETFLTTIIFTE